MGTVYLGCVFARKIYYFTQVIHFLLVLHLSLVQQTQNITEVSESLLHFEIVMEQFNIDNVLWLRWELPIIVVFAGVESLKRFSIISLDMKLADWLARPQNDLNARALSPIHHLLGDR